MTQEEKQLLLQDLCARLPYGVIISVKDIDNFQFDGILRVIGKNWCRLNILDPIKKAKVKNQTIPLNNIYIKPYLRPMSSMTEEEFNELATATELQYDQLELMDWGNDKTLEFYLSEVPQYCVIKVFDWLNAHHFDYRSLITMGIALEAPGGMYAIK